MRQHAFVTWVETSAPWELETNLLSSGLRRRHSSISAGGLLGEPSSGLSGDH
jgi:hypothetical protein